MTRDAGTASFTKPHAVRQQFVDEEAPFLLRPPGDDPEDGRNWVVKAVERTGQSVDEALHTWIYGFTLEPELLFAATAESKGDEEARTVCAETWANLPDEIREAAASLLTATSEEPPYGLELEVELADVLARTGRTAEEELVFWNRAFTAHDHQMWQVLEHHYGAREGLMVYSRVWEQIALTFLDAVKATIGPRRSGRRGPREDEPSLLGGDREQVEEVETTPDRHVAIIKTCRSGTT